MKHVPDVNGTAALTICEALLLALNDRNILPEKEIMGILNDASETHKTAAVEQDEPELNTQVAELIDKIIAGRNSVRRP